MDAYSRLALRSLRTGLRDSLPRELALLSLRRPRERLRLFEREYERRLRSLSRECERLRPRSLDRELNIKELEISKRSNNLISLTVHHDDDHIFRHLHV